MSFVSLTREPGGLGTLSIHRAEKLNSLDAETLIELRSRIAELAREPARVVLLQSDGEKAFVAGADIASMAQLQAPAARRFATLGHEVFDALEALPCVVLACVQGVALGGGCELVLASDLVIAADRARFGQPETNLGIMPGFGGCSRLLRRVGPARAREMIYSGRILLADEALQIGLVNRVVPAADLQTSARAWAEELLARPPLALAHAKAAMAAAETSDARTAARVEIEAFSALFASRDAGEGLAAFLEKRKPEFRGE